MIWSYNANEFDPTLGLCAKRSGTESLLGPTSEYSGRVRPAYVARYTYSKQEKREITTSVRDFNLKRVELVRQFSEFKDSLRFEGEVPKQ